MQAPTGTLSASIHILHALSLFLSQLLRWQGPGQAYAPVDEDVFVGGNAAGLTANEEEEEGMAGYLDGYVGGAAEVSSI